MKKTKIIPILLLLLTSCSPVEQTKSNNIIIGNSHSSINLSSTIEDSFNYEECNKGVVTCLNYVLSGGKLALGSFGSGFFFNYGTVYPSNSNYYYIMSNQHVIEGNKQMHILTYYNQEIEVDVVGSDEFQDVSVMKVLKSKLTKPVKVFDLSESIDPILGEEVYAIGTPADLTLRRTLNVGTVSGLNRIVVPEDDYMFYQAHAIHVDCAVNSGNSGGPLFNKDGKVIAVNTLKIAEQGNLSIEGINFSLPIHDMLAIATHFPDLLLTKTYKTRFGLQTVSTTDKEQYISMFELDIRTRNQLGLNSKYQGVVILFENNILEAPLYSLIVNVDGQDIKDVYDLRHILIEKSLSDRRITIKYYPNNDGVLGALTTKNVTLTSVTLNYSAIGGN